MFLSPRELHDSFVATLRSHEGKQYLSSLIDDLLLPYGRKHRIQYEVQALWGEQGNRYEYGKLFWFDTNCGLALIHEDTPIAYLGVDTDSMVGDPGERSFRNGLTIRQMQGAKSVMSEKRAEIRRALEGIAWAECLVRAALFASERVGGLDFLAMKPATRSTYYGAPDNPNPDWAARGKRMLRYYDGTARRCGFQMGEHLHIRRLTMPAMAML